MASLVWLVLVCAVTGQAYETYDGYKVLEVTPQTKEQLELLTTLANDDKLSMMYGLDFWKEPSKVGRPVHLMLPPQSVSLVQGLFTTEGMTATEYIEDVSELIDERYYTEETRNFDYADYNTYEAILAELDVLVEDCPSGLTCETYSIGTSEEGRDLKVFRMYKAGEERTAYWLDSVIHAREWLAVATHMQILNTLVRDYETIDDARYLVDTYDWYSLPVMNPDGYSFTWTDNRFWRKSRSANPGSSCIGTDLNRNYDYKWGGVGTSSNPCSETYGGSGAESEVETRAVVAEMERVSGGLEAWISMHTYSQYWLTPWGDCEYDPDGDLMLAVANAAADASEAASGDTWDRGNWCQVLYPSTGILQDYVKAAGGVPFTFTPELRDDGYGFAPPASSIPMSYDEIWGGLKALVQSIEDSKTR